MYAILQHGGHQYRVASGDRILVDRIPVEVGSTVTLESVLLLGDGAESDVAKGSPVEASVTATVIAHRKGRRSVSSPISRRSATGVPSGIAAS